MLHFTGFFCNFISSLLVKRVRLLVAAFAMAFLDVISLVHFVSFVTVLAKLLKYPAIYGCSQIKTLLTNFCAVYRRLQNAAFFPAYV